MGKRKGCPFCGSLNLHTWALGKLRCKGCNRVFPPFNAVMLEYVPKKRGAKSSRGQSDRQEKKKVKLVGGRQTIASGQTPIDKADIKSEHVRMECKYTDKASFTLKQSDLVKVAAASMGEQIPVFLIEFREHNDSYCVVPEGWFLQLLEAYKNDKNY